LAAVIILGVDPGKTGALAFYDPRLDHLEVIDVPVIAAGTRNKKVVDEDALAELIRIRADFVTHAFIELVNAMPKEGAVGAFSFGTTFGLLRMAVVAHRIPRTYVTPQKWKKATGAPAAKDGAAARASQLLPRHASHWTIKRLHCNQVQAAGRSEAALIAYYGSQQLAAR
jgi:hypothetical protein